MFLEIVAIGNEILSGLTLNTNTEFLSNQLYLAGYSVLRQTTLPDEEAKLRDGLNECLTRSNIIITTGGLGPTLDDITRKVAAQIYQSEFILNEDVAKDLTQRFGHDFPTLKDQATVPAKAKVLMNATGTAPGLIFDNKDSTLIMLPGVPGEMRAMFKEHVLPFIEENFPLSKKMVSKALHLFQISEHEVDPFLRVQQIKFPEVEYGIYPGLGHLTIRLKVFAEDDKPILEKSFFELEKKFAALCYFSKSGELEEAVHHTFTSNQLTLSLAESCTGGAAAARLTAIPGASQYFLGSIVSYANSVKTDVLKVPKNLVEEKGAISEEVVKKMVLGVLDLTGSDFALAVSGIAGPEGGTDEKPVGTIWCAVCRQGALPHTWKLKLKGNRQMVITKSINSLFSNLLIYTKETSLL